MLIAALTAASLGLAACEGGQNRRAASGGGLCKPFVGVQTVGPGLADGGAVVDDCLHRWGYTLAKADDDAGLVAQAVVAACSAPLSRWNQQTLSNAAATGVAPEGPSLLTGEPTNPIAEHANFAENRALFYVIQARAGKCDAPRTQTDRKDQAQPVATPNSPDQ